MNKIQIICWMGGVDMHTRNESFFIEMPSDEVVKGKFIDNAMARFRSLNVSGWKEVINIINHGPINKAA